MAEREQDPRFAPGVILRKQSFGKGKGEIIKVGLKWEEFKEWAEENINDNGFVNVDIKTAKSDSNKLYMEINTWVPNNSNEESHDQEYDEDPAPNDDGLPF